MNDTPSIFQPAIIIPAYNRPDSLNRLLQAVVAARYPDIPVTLVISIDKSEELEVARVAEQLEWPHGPKKVILQEEHLGLKKHILACGDLTEEYPAIIVLEDDLLVSPYFYEYTIQALAYYHSEQRIAGISLYHYEIAESCFYPFQAIDDGSDVYFIQVASSWGQAWSRAQWRGFRDWFAENPEIASPDEVPDYINLWSSSSWKKHFIHYLIRTDQYFVFPRLALSTNFTEPGTNAVTKGLYQVALQMGEKAWAFKPLEESNAVYDAGFELQPSRLNRLVKGLEAYSYEIDLYGVKNIDRIEKDYLLTTRASNQPILSFGMEMSPNIANVIHQIKGHEISLTAKKNLKGKAPSRHFYYPQIASIADYVFKDLIEQKAEKIYQEDIKTRYPADFAVRYETDFQNKFDLALQKAIQQYELKKTHPKISVIIPILEGREGLVETIQSIWQQQYPFLEYILVNSGIDALTEDPALESCLNRAAHIVHQPAIGFAESILKGFEKSSGELLTILRPGEQFLHQAFQGVREVFIRHPQINWLTGLATQASKDGFIVRYQSIPESRWATGKYQQMLQQNLPTIPLAGTFWRRSLLEKNSSELSLSKGTVPEESLWTAFFKTEAMYTFTAYLASSPIGKQDEKKGLSINPFRWCFQKDLVLLRYFYKKQQQFPPIVRYEYLTDSYYLSNY